MKNYTPQSNISAEQYHGIQKHKTIKALCTACNENMSTIKISIGSIMINMCDSCKQELIGVLK